MTNVTYHPGSRPVGGEFRPVVRVFRDGKPIGSKSAPITYPTSALAELAAYLAASKATRKVAARVVVRRA